MKSKLICDGCNKKLREIIEELESCVFIISDNIGGLSMIKHNNCKNHVVLCEDIEFLVERIFLLQVKIERLKMTAKQNVKQVLNK